MQQSTSNRSRSVEETIELLGFLFYFTLLLEGWESMCTLDPRKLFVECIFLPCAGAFSN